MSINLRREYFQEVIKRYHRSSKKVKGVILDEFSSTFKLNRNYTVRLFNEGYSRKRKCPGRVSQYASDKEMLETLKRLWFVSDQACGKTLKEAICGFLPDYEACYGKLSEESRERLLKVSASTIDRLLRSYRIKHPKRGKSLTKPGTLLKKEVPIRGTFDETVPGFMEMDTVAHCGDKIEGSFIWSLTMTDIATSWTENRAVWTRMADNTIAAIKDIKESLPFPIKGLDSDNGAEFLNKKLVRYCAHQGIVMTRSRPYRKNDNAHVEQKNWATARQLLGYERLENPDLVPLINDLYKHEWCWYKNMYIPCFKLKEKIKVGSKYKRIYDKPKTPLQRVLESPDIAQEKKEELLELKASLNVFKLKEVIEQKLKRINKLAKISFEEWERSQPESVEEEIPLLH